MTYDFPGKPRPASAEDAKPPQFPSMSAMTETILTTSRPLGQAELWFLSRRQSRGLLDVHNVLTLQTSGGYSITERDVGLAFAVTCLRHPILTTRVSFTSSPPAFVCATPLTAKHALKASRSLIDFNTFQDVREAASAIHDAWSSSDGEHAIDVRDATCAVWWSKGIGRAEGQYLFGLQMAHFAADGRGRMNVMRHFLELLASPDMARAELSRFYADIAQPLHIPESLEELLPDVSSLSSDDITKGKETYEEYARWHSKPMVGLRLDRTDDTENIDPRMCVHVWSQSKSFAILHACKARGVTVTHLAIAAMALAALYDNQYREQAAGDEGAYYFTAWSVLDLSPRLQPPTDGYEPGTTTRAVAFPVFLYLVQPEAAEPAPLWSLAVQCRDQFASFTKSPHFWQLIHRVRPLLVQNHIDRMSGRPTLPFMSSVGDCTKVLPVSLPGAVGGPQESTDQPPKIKVVDLSYGIRSDATSFGLHLITYDNRLSLRFVYNGLRADPAAMDAYFGRIIEIVSRVGPGLPSL
ncbi:hypothetical protein IEO21_02325 [Rhodonia placenta]|uniref:Uncharacterized protein n=1 Tax=Rhodonia placenta TaxID=104341 RepID=A0A8H7P7S9_9APHY|nr:hypothetical protein IEO21_02325 [Postia placenta]